MPDAYRAFSGADIATDAIARETVLVGLDRMGGGETGPEGRPARRIEPRADLRLHFSPSADWSEWDELLLPVWVSSDGRAVLTAVLRTGTVTPGLHAPDQFHTWAPLGAAARFGRSGWQDVALPYENWHIVGMPDGWRRVEFLELSVRDQSAPVFVGELRGRRRVRRPGPRLTPTGLLAELDLSQADLASVRTAAERGDVAGAETALLEHLRQRSVPRHIFPRLEGADPAGARSAAETLLRHVILDQALPAEIDWRANTNGYLEWRHAFNRHGWMWPLVTAYAATRDERYAAGLDRLLRTWVQQNPEPVGHAGGGDPAWETLSTAVRIYGIWLDLWFALQDSPSFTSETRLLMLRSIWAHAEHLMEHSVTWHSNWEVVESEAIALVGLMFPEFRRAAAWREEGFRRLWSELRRQVHPDGVQWELSPGYHMMSIQGFQVPYQLARLNGLAVPADVPERLERSFDAVLHLTRPDGTLPSLNDSGGVDGTSAAFLRTGHALFGRQDFLWMATAAGEGRAPTAGSHGFDHAGLYVLRSGWERDDRWLVFDGAPLGRSHQHEDKLSFELCAFGTRFIVDPGISSYMREPWTDYFRSAWAHNTVAIDGRPQRRAGWEPPDRQCRSVLGENLWAAGAVLDVVGSEYHGPYGDLDERFVHRRWVLFVKPDYFLVFDEVAGDGTHSVESLLHFAPMRLRVGTGQELVCTDRLGKPNLDVLGWPQSGRWRVRLVTGQNDPVQGWITGADREIQPAPTAVLSRRGRLPIRCAMVLAPYATGTHSGVRIDHQPAPGGAWAALVRLPDGRSDRFHVAWDHRGELAGRGLRTDGRFALVRLAPEGRSVAAAVVAGRTVLLDRRTLLRLDEPRHLAETGLG